MCFYLLLLLLLFSNVFPSEFFVISIAYGFNELSGDASWKGFNCPQRQKCLRPKCVSAMLKCCAAEQFRMSKARSYRTHPKHMVRYVICKYIHIRCRDVAITIPLITVFSAAFGCHRIGPNFLMAVSKPPSNLLFFFFSICPTLVFQNLEHAENSTEIRARLLTKLKDDICDEKQLFSVEILNFLVDKEFV